MTDDEFEEKVNALREEFKNSIIKAIGGDMAVFGGTDEEFLDSYSMALYATISIMSTLASLSVARMLVKEGLSMEEAVSSTDSAYSSYAKDAVDGAVAHLLGEADKIKKMKMMN